MALYCLPLHRSSGLLSAFSLMTDISPEYNLLSLLEILPLPQNELQVLLCMLIAFVNVPCLLISLPNQTKHLREGIFVLFMVVYPKPSTVISI